MKKLKETLLGGLVALGLTIPDTALAQTEQLTISEKEKCVGEDYDTAPTKLDKTLSSQSCSENSYPALYFERYAPRTALDMVGRIPGFQIDSGDNKRGLGNGGANVLINGERISGKTRPREQLSRINATNVLRIEIVDGTSLDIPGLNGQVANVFTTSSGISGTWEWQGEFRKGIEPNYYNAKATVSGKTGDLTWSLTAKNDPFRNGHRGLETQTLADGTLFELRDEDAQFYGDNPGVSADLSWKSIEDHLINLNVEANQFNFNGREFSNRTAVTAAGTTQETLFSNAEDEWNLEIAGDYEFPLGSKQIDDKLKLIGFYRFESSPFISRFDVFDPIIGLTDSSRFSQQADEGETIARAEYSLHQGAGEDWQLALEGAFNYLDIASKFVELGVVPDNPSHSRVEEKRAEVILTHSHKWSEKWDLQFALGVEYSEISQIDTPDITLPSSAPFVRDFIRPKGSFTATYKPDDSLTIVTKIEREVGQLNFFDFISSISIQDRLDTTGNANLVPEQSWLGEIELNKNLGDGNTIKAKIYGALISDLVDRIPVGVNGDAVGNIDSAHRYGLELTTTLKGDKWGYNGTEINLELNLQNSSVDDPVQGFSRRLNRDLKSYWSAQFRHDIPNTDWAWGFFTEQQVNAPSFRLSTINNFHFNGPWGSAFIEHKDVFGLKARMQLANLFGATDDFRREIFTDRRDIGVLDTIEDRSRSFGLIYRIRLSGTF